MPIQEKEKRLLPSQLENTKQVQNLTAFQNLNKQSGECGEVDFHFHLHHAHFAPKMAGSGKYDPSHPDADWSGFVSRLPSKKHIEAPPSQLRTQDTGIAPVDCEFFLDSLNNFHLLTNIILCT